MEPENIAKGPSTGFVLDSLTSFMYGINGKTKSEWLELDFRLETRDMTVQPLINRSETRGHGIL